MKKILNSKYFYFILIFIFILIFNILTPYIMDDWQLMYNFNHSSRIKSIIDVFKELYNMYFTWGGRVLAHFFAYSFLILPKWIFNIVNSLVYVLNIYMIYLICRRNKKDNYKYLLLIHMLLFIFFPTFAQVFLWLDGSCNYSFTLLIQLLFIYKILNIKENKYNYLLYIPLSLLAGMCNENSSLSLIVFLLLYIIYDRSNLKLKIISLISLVLGYLFLFLAPGNYIRMDAVSGKVSLFYHFFDKLKYLLITFWPIIIGLLLIIIVFIIKNKKEGKICLIYYISSLVAMFSMIASPQLNLRSFTMPTIYIFIIIITIILNINKDNLRKIICIVLSIIFVVITITTTKEYIEYNKFMNNRYNKIIKAVKFNKEEVYIKIYKQSNNCRIPYSCELKDIATDKDGFPNYFIGKYYGIKVYGYK